MKPTLAVTMGDPLGIGPEVLVKALPNLQRAARLVVFGHRVILDAAAKLSHRPLPSSLSVREPQGISFTRRPGPRTCGRAALAYLEDAVCTIEQGKCAALVTGPICKEHIQAAGSPYPGHTELLAARASVPQTFLMMVGPSLRVTLVTLHVPLARVPALLSTKQIAQAIALTARALRKYFRLPRPRLAVAGLNPHAGEMGLFGAEEATLIRPAVQHARRSGFNVEGPFPPDALFYRAAQGAFDAVICMYHDQGLIPIKLLHFDRAVNMTLGLPFIRTSVDHGTAFDIAWQNKASPASMIAAGHLAAQLARRSLSS